MSAEPVVSKNAKITGTSLGPEHRGIFTFELFLDYGGSVQSAGGFALDVPTYAASGKFTGREGSATGMQLVAEVLRVVGVDAWEGLPGSYVRVRSGPRDVWAIGHLLEDRWLDFSEFFAARVDAVPASETLAEVTRERDALLAEKWAGPWIAEGPAPGARGWTRHRRRGSSGCVVGSVDVFDDGSARWWCVDGALGHPATSEADGKVSTDDRLLELGWYLSPHAPVPDRDIGKLEMISAARVPVL